MRKLKQFVKNNGGPDDVLIEGQKVECFYYTEHGDKGYKRHWFEKLIDPPFQPVKLGVIVGKAGIFPYWLAAGGKTETYLFVKFDQYFFKKAIPISCIRDAATSASNTIQYLKQNEHLLGKTGFEKKAFDLLMKQATAAQKFTKNDTREKI